MKRLLFNGKIYTMDETMPRADAIIIDENKITFVGKEEEARKLLKDAVYDEFDLKKKTVLPGFCDGHSHLLMLGDILLGVDLKNSDSVENIIEITKKHLKRNGSKEIDWIVGFGWNENLLSDKRMPNRHDLDKISESQPIVLNRICGNLCVLNTKALDYIKIENYLNTPMVGGIIELDEDGNPTGILKGNTAMRLCWEKMPRLGKEKIKERIIKGSQECIKYGITSMQTDDFILERAGDFNDILEAYFELDKENKLPIKFNQMLYLPNRNLLESFLELGYKTGDGSDYFKIGPFKLPTDGTLGAKTAALNEPYVDDEKNFGMLYMTQEEITELAEIAFKNGLQVVMDGIGERAMEAVIESYKNILKDNKEKDLRFGIDHCQITTKKIIEDFGKYNIIAGLEFSFLSSDIPLVEDRIGKERAKWTYNARTFLDNGVIISAGSDIPVESPNPLMGIYSVVTRKQFNGLPEGGWLPEQKLTVEEAVYAYTMGTAYSCFEDNEKGSITTGKCADLVILSDDIFEISPEKIKDVPVKATIIDGKVVYGEI